MNKFVIFLRIFKNKYIISVIVFAVWITFFDRNDLFTQISRNKELKKLEGSVAFYETEIANTKKDLTDFNNEPAIVEKFAREKFYLKRSDEDVFIVNDSTANK